MALTRNIFNCNFLLVRKGMILLKIGGKVMLQRGLLRDVSKALRKASQLYFLLNKYPKFPASALLSNPSSNTHISVTRFAFGDIRSLGRPART
jgi:hypothetical protein